MKGVAYGPMPLKGPGHIPLDDFMAEAAMPLWGPRGRGDLEVMKGMGANTVRIYGNDPRQDHRRFLDAARDNGLHVMVGMSDWPFMQMKGNCMDSSDFDCYQQVKESYMGNLRQGFLEAGSYHSSLSYMNVINEPDLKMPGIEEPALFCRSIISAVDGIVDAEKEMNVTGPLLNLTVTFSFALCTACLGADGKPGLGQMLELRRAFLDPERFGYKPRNDLAAIYAARFVNSFNTQNPSTDVRPLLLDAYEVRFPDVPVFIGEFHAGMRPDLDPEADLRQMLAIAENSPLLLGVTYFEYQVRYDKGGTEMNFGIFGLGDYELTSFVYFTHTYPVFCLTPVRGLPGAVAAAYGAEGNLDFARLCEPDPRKVPLNATGFNVIPPAGRAVFATRVVEHMGGQVRDTEAFHSFVNSTGSFQQLLLGLGQHPAWANWDEFAACVADRGADKDSVSRALEEACHGGWFDCAGIPETCSGDVWSEADYALSVRGNQALLRGNGSSLDWCYHGGAAVYASAEVYRGRRCVVTRDWRTTPLTDEGFQAVLTRNSTDTTVAFLRRVAMSGLHAEVADQTQLWSLAQQPPASMADLLSLFRDARWVCAGQTGRACPAFEPLEPPREFWWMKWAFVFLGVVVLAAAVGTWASVRFAPSSGRVADAAVCESGVSSEEGYSSDGP